MTEEYKEKMLRGVMQQQPKCERINFIKNIKLKRAECEDENTNNANPGRPVLANAANLKNGKNRESSVKSGYQKNVKNNFYLRFGVICKDGKESGGIKMSPGDIKNFTKNYLKKAGAKTGFINKNNLTTGVGSSSSIKRPSDRVPEFGKKRISETYQDCSILNDSDDDFGYNSSKIEKKYIFNTSRGGKSKYEGRFSEGTRKVT
jgi:hypothetical protein